jgi:aspartate carbamoyltransferase catalytic subunit
MYERGGRSTEQNLATQSRIFGVFPSPESLTPKPEVFMPFESDKIMFEIYRETTYTGKFRVVYFTELQDHNKETEISRAMAGEHFYDGFIRAYRKDQAKEMIEKILARMNEGEKLSPEQVESEIKAFIPI